MDQEPDLFYGSREEQGMLLQQVSDKTNFYLHNHSFTIKVR
jgi:hypothetical protein